jgi:hypothetical protein
MYESKEDCVYLCERERGGKGEDREGGERVKKGKVESAETTLLNTKNSQFLPVSFKFPWS